MRVEYSQKLKHPRWQKKRLEILEREGFKGQCCDDTEKTLQVHHLIYSRGEPWDAPDDTLECLCRDCHEWREDFNKFFGGRTLMPTRFCRNWLTFHAPLFDGSVEYKTRMSLIAGWRYRLAVQRSCGDDGPTDGDCR